MICPFHTICKSADQLLLRKASVWKARKWEASPTSLDLLLPTLEETWEVPRRGMRWIQDEEGEREGEREGGREGGRLQASGVD